jgi:hypothetical protein
VTARGLIRFTAVLALALVGLACRVPRLLRPDCATVLDEKTLSGLMLSMERTVQMQPGGSTTLTLGVGECCYYVEPVDACAVWSVEPSDGAAIDPETGKLSIAATAPSGSVFTVSADVENGRRVVSIDVHVYTPEDNPLVGRWQEEEQFACGTGEAVAPHRPIRELVFRADGEVGVTWDPFELYRDYWGTYAYDLGRGSLDLSVFSGNYVPDDVDGQGTFSLDEQGHLLLSGIWLGAPRGSTAHANCGHRFVR